MTAKPWFLGVALASSCVQLTGAGDLLYDKAAAGGASASSPSSVASSGTPASSGSGGAGGTGGASPSAAYVKLVLADSPLAYYRLGDNPDVGIAKDASTHGRDASYQHGSTFPKTTPGILADDGAIDFDQLESQGGPFVELANGSAVPLHFDATKPFTIELWVRARFHTNQSGAQVPFEGSIVRSLGKSSGAGGGSPDTGYRVVLRSPATLPRKATVDVYLINAGTLTNASALDALSDTDELRHLAVVFDGQHLNLLVDGQPAGGSSLLGSPVASTYDSPLQLAHAEGAPAGSADVVLDEVALYDQALSVAKLKARVACARTGACTPL